MILSNLKLINYRNYETINVSFNKGVNYIVGENATGKTNLVEAIYFLSLARSFKTNNYADLINKNSNSAYIKAEVLNGSLTNKIEIYIDKDGKRISVNKNKIHKISELSALTNCILFVPEDVNLLKDAPSERRNFLNISISKMYRDYQNNLVNYNKLLKARNDLLKEEEFDKNLLEVLTNQLIDEAYKIYSYRKNFISEINKQINIVFNELSYKKDNLRVVYFPFLNVENEEDYKKEAYQKYKDSLKSDLQIKSTKLGIHREDFVIYKNNQNVGVYGSQGENRLSVLSLKLSQYFLNNDFDNKPIVILDDVLSELDENHEKKLINFVKKFSQVFITGTKNNKNLNENKYKIHNNSVTREELL